MQIVLVIRSKGKHLRPSAPIFGSGLPAAISYTFLLSCWVTNRDNMGDGKPALSLPCSASEWTSQLRSLGGRVSWVSVLLTGVGEVPTLRWLLALGPFLMFPDPLHGCPRESQSLTLRDPVCPRLPCSPVPWFSMPFLLLPTQEAWKTLVNTQKVSVWCKVCAAGPGVLFLSPHSLHLLPPHPFLLQEHRTPWFLHPLLWEGVSWGFFIFMAVSCTSMYCFMSFLRMKPDLFLILNHFTILDTFATMTFLSLPVGLTPSILPTVPRWVVTQLLRVTMLGLVPRASCGSRGSSLGMTVMRSP